jgi:DNA topoisomerase-1
MAARRAPQYEWCAAAELVVADHAAPGIRRRRAGKGWVLHGPDGARVTDPAVLARVRALAIPPAWTDVWICGTADGHVQATGRDARGRKQYRYHPSFRAHREDVKFEGLSEFGRSLGGLRRRVDADLGRPGLPREKVVALVVRLLEETAVRVGNEEYARTNHSYGLTTLRNRHARWEHGAVVFRFAGKSGRVHEVQLEDRRLVRAVRRCGELPGQLLLQYVDEDGRVEPVSSADVNEYLRAATGIDVTAKHFRTWIGTLLAAELLAEEPPPTSQRQAASTIVATMRTVSDRLGNTPAVCRRSYVHPIVEERYLAGTLGSDWDAGPTRPAGGLSASERKLLALLAPNRKARRKPAAALAA